MKDQFDSHCARILFAARNRFEGTEHDTKTTYPNSVEIAHGDNAAVCKFSHYEHCLLSLIPLCVTVVCAECAGLHCVTDDKERALRNRHFCFPIEKYVNRFVLFVAVFPSTASICCAQKQRKAQLKTNT